MALRKYITLEKAVGQTPLQCAEAWRAEHPEYQGLPLAYAGRLDPMASGTLLILIGEECKVQERYHDLDKRYEFSVLFGVGSDTGDVLGRLSFEESTPSITRAQIKKAALGYTGIIQLPYPAFSSKTVKGKPLHTWTLEGKLADISIPQNTSVVHELVLRNIVTKRREDIWKEASEKIETIPPVTELRKAIGNDFRRVDVRRDWQEFKTNGSPDDLFTIATFSCVATSGTYMRSLAEALGTALGTKSLAYHIHRTHIGRYLPLPLIGGVWRKRY